jgi:hypothetical protein
MRLLIAIIFLSISFSSAAETVRVQCGLNDSGFDAEVTVPAGFHVVPIKNDALYVAYVMEDNPYTFSVNGLVYQSEGILYSHLISDQRADDYYKKLSDFQKHGFSIYNGARFHYQLVSKNGYAIEIRGTVTDGKIPVAGEILYPAFDEEHKKNVCSFKK